MGGLVTDESFARDPIGEEANRRAHRGMRVLVSSLATDDELAEAHPELEAAARSYAEIERRAEAEATL
jgi:hypothetical protein